MEDDMPELEGSTVVLTDETGRQLPCFVEQTLEVEGQIFLLIMPVDAPIELFVWQSEDDEDEDEVLIDVEEEDIDPLFPTARAVLAELDLLLQRSAYTLTAAGEPPEAEEDDCFTLELSDDSDQDGEATTEEFQMLATFFHEDQQYTLCTPLEPLLFFAQQQPDGEVTLVSPEAFQSVRSQLEDQLFDVLE
ncbi:DUF3727 domain-containing protein [Romeria aff. gracilis LEGE 07310]|uniref:DUF3727 domain-containing protein n=1 Tax=Vasconcelosia minhoensis LEGE 07310 TaxID=915328 RepID=A0A8J7A5W6_9CYAN|nr:DUF3727 domain-containing protein [Romeria gracilis]MBE9077117.1 DUF3727 domain-containing protein [Romeria aff. gracilis LEGE 07310]